MLDFAIIPSMASLVYLQWLRSLFDLSICIALTGVATTVTSPAGWTDFVTFDLRFLTVDAPFP
jgi:hypothetical protein